MVRKTVIICLVVLTQLAWSQSNPPINLRTHVQPGGIVTLNWDEPFDGLYEDFEDSIAQDFEWLTPGGGSLVIENGYAELEAGIGLGNWASGAYMPADCADLTCEIELENVLWGASKGLLFRGDGPRDDDFNGYGFLLGGYPGIPKFLVGVWIDGSPWHLIYWTDSDAINDGQGATNVLKVVAQESTAEFYINDVLVDTEEDLYFTNGKVGFMQAEAEIVRYNWITCADTAALLERNAEIERSEPVNEWLDISGQPTNQSPESWSFQNRKGEILSSAQADKRWDNNSHDLDEFVEYRVYRDEILIGTSTTGEYIDQLDNYGESEYRVSAYFDPEGESHLSVPATAHWNTLTFTLTPQFTMIPGDGGEVLYDAQLFSELDLLVPNVSYQTFITDPDGVAHGPAIYRHFTLRPFANHCFTGLSQPIPDDAQVGHYVFTGKLFHRGNVVLEQSFPFTKMGP